MLKGENSTLWSLWKEAHPKKAFFFNDEGGGGGGGGVRIQILIFTQRAHLHFPLYVKSMQWIKSHLRGILAQ